MYLSDHGVPYEIAMGMSLARRIAHVAVIHENSGAGHKFNWKTGKCEFPNA